MRKTARHEIVCTSQPPRAGPIVVAIAVPADQVPTARPRSSSGKAAPSIARLAGTRSAPPTPWIARDAMSAAAFGATPQASDAAAKTRAPSTKTRRRPNRSASAPPTRMSEERKSAYASTTH